MPLASVATDVNQPLNVLPNNPSKISFDDELSLDDLSKTIDLVLSESTHLAVRCNLANRKGTLRDGTADSIDVSQRNLNVFFAGNINPGNACHLSRPFSS